jgi:CheY-like chemotaxis protein
MKKLECILLVDDNANDNYYHLLTIRETISTKQVKTVRDALQAIDYLEKGKTDPVRCPFPDLIFLDINMPGMDGFEFLQEIRERGLFFDNKPVIVVMTNSLNEENERNAKQNFAGEVVAFIKKPLTSDVLNGILENYFQKK